MGGDARLYARPASANDLQEGRRHEPARRSVQVGRNDHGPADGCRGERHGPHRLLPHEFRREADREQPADRLAAEPGDHGAGRDESMQYARETDVPVDVAGDEEETQIDRAGGRRGHEQPRPGIEQVFEQRTNQQQRCQIGPEVAPTEVDDMSRDETPILTLDDQDAVVPAPQPPLLAGRFQGEAREGQSEDRPTTSQSPMSDVFKCREEAFVHNGHLNDCAIFGAESGSLPGATVGSRMSLIRTPRHIGQQGFTLLEIMVVVVIIGLLAATVVPRFIGNIDTATINRAKQDIRGIETALNLYRLDNFRYPSTSEGLAALVTNPGETSAPNWKQQLPRLPVDPWNRPYQYAYPGQHGEFDVFSLGADGQEGGDGVNADIGNWEL